MGQLKFIQISDLHVLQAPQKIRGIDPRARLEVAVDCIRNDFADVEFCMVTGDLSDDGEVASYQEARRILDGLPCPWHALMGNHDGRHSHAQAVLPDLPWRADGSLQYGMDTSVGRFVVLDSSVGGDVDSGRLSASRLAFLHAELQAAQDVGSNVFLFMHHPPFNIGIDWLDKMKLENSDEFWGVLKDFPNILHMFFGHIHRPTNGSWHGIPFSTVRATAHQVRLRLDNAAPEFTNEQPSFAVVLADDQQVVIHHHDFLKTT